MYWPIQLRIESLVGILRIEGGSSQQCQSISKSALLSTARPHRGTIVLVVLPKLSKIVSCVTCPGLKLLRTLNSFKFISCVPLSSCVYVKCSDMALSAAISTPANGSFRIPRLRGEQSTTWMTEYCFDSERFNLSHSDCMSCWCRVPPMGVLLRARRGSATRGPGRSVPSRWTSNRKKFFEFLEDSCPISLQV